MAWRRIAGPAFAVAVAVSLLLATGTAVAQSTSPAANMPSVVAEPCGSGSLLCAKQGWTAQDRKTFYTTRQGSHLMPYAWFKALRRLDSDTPFAGDQLERYGYLRNDSPDNTEGLPVGFVVESSTSTRYVGMTCAACHTGQIAFKQGDALQAMRIDGAPALADFQQFLTDLTVTSRATLSEPDRFAKFADTVLGQGRSAASADRLKTAFAEWVQQFGSFMDASLPKPPALPWGPGRLDAFGMIFNRVAARDLGVDQNFARADAPVSYPFLWNASRQDHTQWPGTVPNGRYVEALARNTGEVFGVFADFHPRSVLNIPFFGDNSADFAGLQTLEEQIVKLQPPAWPKDVFGLNQALADEGAGLFEDHCASCHGIKTSPASSRLWVTPVKFVHTDPKMLANATRRGKTGLYKGTLLPLPKPGLFGGEAPISDLLAKSVIGSLKAELLIPSDPAKNGVLRAIRKDLEDRPDLNFSDLNRVNAARLERLKTFLDTQLQGLYAKPADADTAGPAYESRVLQGIWATAPYLHNGSVPNLWELLKPARERAPDFKVGSRLYDPKNVGYTTEDTPYATGTYVTDPANANGNGNQGHEYGTDLTETQRWAIVEYLKTL